MAILIVALGALAACATKLQRTLVQPGEVATLDRASKYRGPRQLHRGVACAP